MKGIIVVNAYIKTKSQILQAERIKEELENLGAEVEIKKNFNLAQIKNGEVYNKRYDFCVYLDKDKACARMLEKSGVRLFNCSTAIEICDNKMLTHIALSNNEINMPDCIYAPLCYYQDAKISQAFINEVASTLSFPLIAKKCYGSLGAGVYLINNLQQLKDFEEENKLCEHFYQKFIDCGKGEDIRVIVIGGKYVCSMKRTNENDFRSNVELGGKGQNFIADEKIISLCERVASLLNLYYCGIDVIVDKDGERYICEVNSNAFFAEAERVCKVNIAKIYAQHVLNSLCDIDNCI
ncbi:MAG: RimK family alpha-L-glutamate ligase [Clostridiales bacterium]|nr:RimK family alpha-L-glutamate ligase [Clostridiales bacterium]